MTMTLGEGMVLAYSATRKIHKQLQHDIRKKEMQELMTAVNDGRAYRKGRDASPELTKMKEYLTELGAELQTKRKFISWS